MLRMATAEKGQVSDLNRHLVDRWREVSLRESLILTASQRSELERTSRPSRRAS
jgi:hypothetical protein